MANDRLKYDKSYKTPTIPECRIVKMSNLPFADNNRMSVFSIVQMIAPLLIWQL